MKNLVNILFLLLGFLPVSAQELLKFEVTAENPCPVVLSLDQYCPGVTAAGLALFELKGKTETAVPFQIEAASGNQLWFMFDGATSKSSKRMFVLRKSDAPLPVSSPLTIVEKNGALSINSAGKTVLSYQTETVSPPADVSPFYKRSAFLHPVCSPGGEILTRIQAPDHYHHYGIWNPWTLTFIGKREVDFWNLAKGQGTVRFAGMASRVEGAVYSGFKSLQEHIDFGALGGDAVAISELFDLRVWNLAGQKYMFDYTSTLNTPLDSGILLAAYRYGGGIGWRATEKWHKNNCTVLTSEGKTRADADGSNARWCIVEGESSVKEGRSGILIMSHPANRAHPEPMRVWPLDANNGRGDMFFEFCPIRHNDWKLERGTDYSLRYRLVVFDGKMTADEAESYWRDFANPPAISIKTK